MDMASCGPEFYDCEFSSVRPRTVGYGPGHHRSMAATPSQASLMSMSMGGMSQTWGATTSASTLGGVAMHGNSCSGDDSGAGLGSPTTHHSGAGSPGGSARLKQTASSVLTAAESAGSPGASTLRSKCVPVPPCLIASSMAVPQRRSVASLHRGQRSNGGDLNASLTRWWRGGGALLCRGRAHAPHCLYLFRRSGRVRTWVPLETRFNTRHEAAAYLTMHSEVGPIVCERSEVGSRGGGEPGWGGGWGEQCERRRETRRERRRERRRVRARV